MRYRIPRARRTDSRASRNSYKVVAWSLLATFSRVTSLADEVRTIAISLRPLLRRVDPLDVRSTIMSAMPSLGALSVAPDTGTISTDRPAELKYSAVTRG